jgi:hypothetical protein
MLTARMQTSEASMTTFKDDALAVAVILYWMNRVYVKFLKAHNDEYAENLILILSLEMENTVFNLSKHLVVI